MDLAERVVLLVLVIANATNKTLGKLTRKLIDQIKTDKIKEKEKEESHKIETFLELFNPNLSTVGKAEKFDGTFEKKEDGELVIGIRNKFVITFVTYNIYRKRC